MKRALMRSQRIQLIGCSGAGKTTLGLELAACLHVPFVDLDELYWEPGWVGVGHAELARRLAPTLAGDAWVVAGNYTKTTERDVWPRLTQLVVLDLPLPTLLRRTARRSAQRVITGQPCCNGNRETLRHALGHDAPLRYTLRVWKGRHARYAALGSEPRLAQAELLRLKSEAEVDAWRASWPR
jgi:adenylate kinase family enzyme